MADDKLQDDGFNFDDFNFDDLADDGSINISDETADLAKGDNAEFSLDNFSFDDVLGDDASVADGRKEPFFETQEAASPEALDGFEVNDEAVGQVEEVGELQETPAGFDTDVVETEATNAAGNLIDDVSELDAQNSETLENEANLQEILPDETENGAVAETVSIDDFAEEASAAADDFSQDVASESFDSVQPEENFESESLVETSEEVSTDVEHEAFFAEEAADEAPIIEEETFSNEEALEQHEEFFAEEAVEEVPLTEDTAFSNEEALEQHEEFFATNTADAELQESVQPLDAGGYCGYDDSFSAVSMMEESRKVGFLQWYSAQSDIKMFEISKGFSSGNFTADEECKTLHVNVGYDTYGWEVQFSDGVVMNLRDIREYQLRNGRLPNSEGRIVYGGNSLLFSGVERIVVYESVKYFSYGA